MNTFITRTNNINITSNVDALKLIDYILSLDVNNRIVENGKLYKLATNQYNNLIKNSLIRPTLPTWFCGKIDDNSGLLLTTNTDLDIRQASGTSSPSASANKVQNAATSAYAADTCLVNGTPGSFGYSNCKSNITEDTNTGIALAGLDWSAEVYSIASPSAGGSSGGDSSSSTGGGDRGGEIWQNWNGMNIRLYANPGEAKQAGIAVKNAWYPIAGGSGAGSAVSLSKTSNGATMTGRSFTSKTGKNYKFVGWWADGIGKRFSSGSTMKLSKSQMYGAVFACWVT